MRVQVIGIVTLAALCGCARQPEAGQGQSLCTLDSAAQQQRDAAFTAQRGGRNLTAEFTQRFCAQQSPQGAESARSLNGCDVLLVHGWLGETAIRLTDWLDNLSCNQRVLDYLKDQRNAADELGLCSITPPFRSESVCASGEKLACLIAHNPRPIVIISHSKGCLDTLDALLRLQRSGQLNKVTGWIALQGPFYGTEEADSFIRRNNPVGKLRIKLLGARIQGVCDMTPGVRAAYMAEHSGEIDTLIHAIPVLCFASWKNTECPEELLTDGHVEPASALLPGADYIAKSGITHAQPVLTRKSLPFDRLGFSRTLLAMLGEKINAAGPQHP